MSAIAGGRRVVTAARGLLVVGVLVAGLAVAPAAQAAYECGSTLDDFNRPPSTALGPNWIERAQDYSINNGRAEQAARNFGTLLYKDTSASQVCVDVTIPNGTALYADAGVTLNYADPANSIVVKVQNNHSDKFDTLYFYRGYPGTVLAQRDLRPTFGGAFRAARLVIDIRRIADQTYVNALIDKDFNGAEDYVTDHPIDPAGFGAGIGLVSYGPTTLDNFTAVNPIFAPGAGGTPGSGPNGTTTGSDTTRPTLRGLRFSRSSFAAARSGASISAKKKRKPKIGTKVSFNLSEISSVKFTVERKARGRTVGKKCAKPKRSNRGNKKCTRVKKVRGSFTVTGNAAKNTFTFRGRMGGKRLKPGSYRLNSRATDKANNQSRLARKSFKIVK